VIGKVQLQDPIPALLGNGIYRQYLNFTIRHDGVLSMRSFELIIAKPIIPLQLQ
jgi:hypothetical protein